VLKLFTACLSTVKKADVLLILLEQIKPIVNYMLNNKILLHLFSNLLNLGVLTYDGLDKSQIADSPRMRVIRETEEQLTLVLSWTSFLQSTVKKLNSKNSVDGLLYLAKQDEFSTILKQILMLALDENVSGEGNYSRCLAIVGNKSFQDFGNDTLRIVLLINESKEKALTFLKVIWQFLWVIKHPDVFIEENSFYKDAGFFLPILGETLIKLPQMAISIDHLIMNRHIARIIKKAAELLAIFVK
jgi:hypothetical protein